VVEVVVVQAKPDYLFYLEAQRRIQHKEMLVGLVLAAIGSTEALEVAVEQDLQGSAA
jgi:hypothetical protein